MFGHNEDTKSVCDDDESKGKKRDSSWLEELTESGEIEAVKTKISKYDTDGKTAITQYRYINGDKFKFAKCNTCCAVLSAPAGSHWKRHQERQCLSVKMKFDASKVQNTMQVAIADYCLKSGASFRMTESEAFRDLLRTCMFAMNENISMDSIISPCRQTVRNLVELKCDETLQVIKKIITPHVKNGSGSLILDFGLHIVNYLSGFISFIGEDEQGLPELKVEPFCFLPMYAVKTAENIRDELLRAGRYFEFTEEEVLSLNTITDGAANISSMGRKYFKNWALCACHSIQKMSQRLLIPKKSLKSSYSDHELSELERFSGLLEKCYKLALLIHKKKVVKN